MNFCGCRHRNDFFSVFTVALLLFMHETMNVSGRSVNQTWYQSSRSPTAVNRGATTSAITEFLQGFRHISAQFTGPVLCLLFGQMSQMHYSTAKMWLLIEGRASPLSSKEYFSAVCWSEMLPLMHTVLPNLLSIHIGLGMNLAMRNRCQGRELSRRQMCKYQRCLITMHILRVLMAAALQKRR